MENVLEQIESFVQKTANLAETKAELIKLRAARKLSAKTSSLVGGVIILLVAATALLFLSVGAAVWIGEALHDRKSGFIMIGGLYALGALLLFVFRRQLLFKPLNNFFIDKMIE